jgi:sentrin-specific protease 1
LDTKAEGWTTYTDPKIPRQENGYDCGVFTSQFIECLSRKGGYFDFAQKNMPYLRQKMVHEIKTMDLMPEQWA